MTPAIETGQTLSQLPTEETTMAIISATHDTYTIIFSDGRKVEVEGSYQDALAELPASAEIVGHSGDLTEGGERTLFWASDEDAEDDDGRRALGEIRSAFYDGQS